MKAVFAGYIALSSMLYACDSGVSQSGSTACYLTSCSPGQYLTSGTCVSCVIGKYSTSTTATACTVAPAGKMKIHTYNTLSLFVCVSLLFVFCFLNLIIFFFVTSLFISMYILILSSFFILVCILP